MFALVLLILTAYADTNCCGTRELVPDASYTVCVMPKPEEGCQPGYVESEDGISCTTNDIEKWDCATDNDVTTTELTCQDIISEYEADKCTEPGKEGIGITNTAELEAIGCCGTLPEPKLGNCLCGDQGLLDTYKTFTNAGVEATCGSLEDDLWIEEGCARATLMQDLADFGCCKTAKTDKGADNPKDKTLAELKKDEVAVVTKQYVDDKCETLLKEDAEVITINKCEATQGNEAGDPGVVFKKVEKNDACDTLTLSYYTDEDCKTAVKVEDGTDAKEEEKPTKCDVQPLGNYGTEFVCEPVVAGSQASVLSALVVLLAAALRY